MEQIYTNKMFEGLKQFAKNLNHKSLSPAKRFDLFLESWKKLAQFCVDNENAMVSVEKTTIPDDVNNMMAMLRLESQDSNDSADGPCIEYLLQNKLLDSMCSLGHDDRPVGIKPFILRTFTLYVEECHSSVIPHVNFYMPYKRLMTSCYIRNHPLEEDYVQFLCAIVKRLKSYPGYANCFLHMVPSQNESEKNGKRRFFLLEGLIYLLGSEDTTVVNRACFGILDCMEIQSLEVADAIVDCGSLTQVLIGKLKSLYLALPSNICDNNFKKQKTSKLDSPLNERKKSAREKFASFMTWNEYCNDVMEHAQELISINIMNALSNELFKEIVYLRLQNSSEQIAYTCTVYLNFWLTHISNPLLYDVICDLLFGANLNPEKNDEKVEPTYQLLLDRCESLSPKLTDATLHLFNTLFSKHSAMVYGLLVGRNFTKSVNFKEGYTPLIKTNTVMNLSRAKLNMQKFFDLVPNNGFTCEESETYFKESKIRFYDWEHIDRRVSIIDSDIDITGQLNGLPFNQFYPGKFLNMLLTKLENFIELKYEELLLVSGLVTEICYMGNTYVLNYLLDCDFPAERTLYRILCSVKEEMDYRCSQIENFANLLGKLENINDWTDESLIDPQVIENKQFLQSFLVFGEFCKELTAIACVITTHPMLLNEV